MSAPDERREDDFGAAFLDDYFAECEEHIATVRRALLALEGAVGDRGFESALLEELFRSFHSLKGLSAMVDLRDAERVAHELEDCLRALRDGDRPVTRETIAVLIDSTAVLERVIAARRADQPGPPVEDALARLASVDAATTRARHEPAAGQWRVTFVPSPGLVQRGVKVDVIRERLSSAGHIVRASPLVTAGGGIAFEFLVSGVDDPSVFEPWREDGVSWERLEPAVAGAPPAPDAGTGARAQQAGEAPILAPSHFVRVDLKRLDDVMRRVADLVVTRARLEEGLARIEHLVAAQEWRALQESSIAFERQLRDLREDVMRVRLVRVDEIFRRMPFVARDVAREAGKDVRVVLSGQDTEIDKFLVERMMDPMLHLVRNAVSHGIESPAARGAAGKPPQGVVALTASTAGEMVVLEIADDGAGIDTEAVAARARDAGARMPDGPLDSRTLVDLICEPGFSTRDAADRASGRGVGMSVVRTTVQELGGTLDVETQPGRGTRFTIALPLTLAITDALIAVAGGHTFAVPQGAVQEVIEVEPDSVRRVENSELIPHRGGSLPLLRLTALFNLAESAPSRLHAFVVGAGQDAVALAVDRIVGQREIVVRTMPDVLLKVNGISGATELGDGRVVLILDVAALRRAARADGGSPRVRWRRPGRHATASARPFAGGVGA